MILSKYQYEAIKLDIKELKGEVIPPQPRGTSFLDVMHSWYNRPSLVRRVASLENKVDALLKHLGVEVEHVKEKSGYKVTKRKEK